MKKIKWINSIKARLILTLLCTILFILCFTLGLNVETEVKDNPKTGTISIAIAWFAGLAAIGYSISYFIGLKKKENN